VALIGYRMLASTYFWVVGSLGRLIPIVILLTATVVGLTHIIPPFWSGLTIASLGLLIGGAAYIARRSDIAREYPAVDRFFQRVPCYLSIQDKDLNIIRANELFRRDFGNRLGEKCHKVYKGSDDVCPNCPVIKTFADGKTYSTEETVITRDGQPAQMIVYTTPVLDEKQHITGVMEMSTNITEIKKLQEQLEAGHKEYQELFERVPCYISIQDRDLRIIKCNQRFEQEFGDPRGKYCYEVFKNRDCICPDCHALKTLEDGAIHSRETTVIRKDGSPARLVAYSSPIFNDAGEIEAVMEMSTDISEVKRLERELADMGRTIAVMAHRIKNILMGLEGGIFVVNAGIEDGDDAMIKKGWGMIERNVQNVSRIVKDLLFCSREREMNFEQCDPAPIVHSVYDLFKGRARKGNTCLDLEIEKSLPDGRFDPEALHSLLTNLVTNALDACVNDASENRDCYGIVVRGWYDSDDRQHIFEVEDNGTGIPGHVGDSVFDDFFSTKGREGTGLGLLVAHKIVEEHGGRITFRSRDGQGTVFRVIFPLHESA